MGFIPEKKVTSWQILNVDEVAIYIDVRVGKYKIKNVITLLSSSFVIRMAPALGMRYDPYSVC